MTATVPLRILVVDDHALMREGIEALLSRQGDLVVVGSLSTAEDALQHYSDLDPDVTVMDIQMPGMGGLAAIRKIRAIDHDAGILVLTTYPGDAQAVRALRDGASGYLLKSDVRGELVDAVRAVAKGRKAISAEVAHEIAQYAFEDPLNEREIEILRLIADGLSNKMVAAQLNLSVDTVKSYLKSAFQKLDVSDRTYAVTVARRRGYLTL